MKKHVPLEQKIEEYLLYAQDKFFSRNITLHTHSDLMNYGLSSNLIDEEAKIVLRFV